MFSKYLTSRSEQTGVEIIEWMPTGLVAAYIDLNAYNFKLEGFVKKRDGTIRRLTQRDQKFLNSEADKHSQSK